MIILVVVSSVFYFNLTDTNSEKKVIKVIDRDIVELVEFKTDKPEKLIPRNNYNFNLEILFKNDATRIYRETISGNSLLIKTLSHTWNTNKDSPYVKNSNDLILFHRY